MSCKRELQRSLGNRYSYERLLSDREIQRLKTHIPSDFYETVAAVLTAGCLRLNAVLYLSCKELLLGYDVFVKDNPASPEWICYNSLPAKSVTENDMAETLDNYVKAHELAYEDCCFTRQEGKIIKPKKE